MARITAYVAVFHLKILIVEMVVMGSIYASMGRLDILFVILQFFCVELD